MSESFAQSVLKIAMAQICQNLGWHAVQTSPMNILVDILHRYLFTLAKTTHQFSEHYNRTEPNLNDLGLAFKELGISLTELEEYVNNVEPVPFVHSVPSFPLQRTSQFHFPKDGCREVQHRPEWFHPHLPPAYPELEEDESVFSPSAMSDSKACLDGLPNTSFENGMCSPTGSPRPGMRRPLEITQDTNFSTPKRPRLQSDEEGRPMREVISVTMTAAGVISPAREGRLPDARTPLKGFEDSRPSTPVAPEAPLSPPPVPVPPKEPEPAPKPKEAVKKEENIGKISKMKNSQKIKEAKKVKIKKDNKENKKKSLKEGRPKLKKKENNTKPAKVGRSPGRPPKIKKEKVEKSAKVSSVAKSPKSPSVAKSPKSPKVPKVPKPKVPKLKPAKGEEKLKSPLASAKDGATKASPKPAKKHAAKPPKSPKGPKVKGKSPKLEKSVPGGQLASLLAKASGVATIKAEKMSAESSKVAPVRDRDFQVAKLEPPDARVTCDSPERLVIVDNPEHVVGQERDPRLAAVDECISAVIQRGLHDGEHHTQNSNSSSNAKSDSEGLSTVPAKVKLEPRDVYDFTDDEEVAGADKFAEEPSSAPLPKMDLPPVKPKKEEIIVVKEKYKEPRKSTRKEGERRGRKPKGWVPTPIKVEPKVIPEDVWPKTPEPIEDPSEMPPMPSSFHGSSAFGMSMLSGYDLSSLSHIPPALLPFSIPSYPPPMCPPLGSGDLSPGPSSVPGSHMPYPKLVDLADVAISKARNEGDFDVAAPKEKEQREKDKGKRKEKREKKEKEKLKLKKKKEKTKDKGAEKVAAAKDRGKQAKSKKEKAASSAKVKEKKVKVDKVREKEKKKEKEKDKGKDKVKEKKEKVDKKKKEKSVKKEKPEKVQKEEIVVDGDSANSSVPRLTFKLGSGMVSDGTKIVIKGLSNVDSPSASPLPPTNEPSPPISPMLPAVPQRLPPVTQSSASSSGKSHPKPQSKVQPVPPAPARTVITETVGTIIDEAGNKIWICPACTRPDDGSPMIGCDDCDEWYHWVCVGIVVPPKEDENWFCTRCIAKKQSTQRKRKHRKEK